jgi:hypothetical protein
MNLFPGKTVEKSGSLKGRTVSTAPQNVVSSSEFTLIPRYMLAQRGQTPRAASPISRISARSDFIDVSEVLVDQEPVIPSQVTQTPQPPSHEGNSTMPVEKLQTSKPSDIREPHYRPPSPSAGVSSVGTGSTESIPGSNVPLRTLGDLVRGSIAAVTIGYTDELDVNRGQGKKAGHYVVQQRRSPSGIMSPNGPPDVGMQPSDSGVLRARDAARSSHRSASDGDDAYGQSLLGHLGAEIWEAFAP